MNEQVGRKPLPRVPNNEPVVAHVLLGHVPDEQPAAAAQRDVPGGLGQGQQQVLRTLTEPTGRREKAHVCIII